MRWSVWSFGLMVGILVSLAGMAVGLEQDKQDPEKRKNEQDKKKNYPPKPPDKKTPPPPAPSNPPDRAKELKEKELEMYKGLMRLLEVLDTNHDRKISPDEWIALYRGSDAAKDGLLTFDEFWKEFALWYMKQRDEKERDPIRQTVRKTWDAMDKNKDGKITLEEWKEAGSKDSRSKPEDIQKGFDIADRDESSDVNEDELTEYARAMYLKNEKGETGKWLGMVKDFEKRLEARKEREKEKEKEEQRKAAIHKMAEEKRKIEEQARKDAGEVLDKNDANKDNKISRDEWKYGEDEFDEWDKTGDGYLSRDELVAYFRAQIVKSMGTQKE